MRFLALQTTRLTRAALREVELPKEIRNFHLIRLNLPLLIKGLWLDLNRRE